MARLFFFAHLDPARRRETVQAYLQQLSQTQTALLGHQPVIEENADPFQLACFKCGLRLVEDLKKNIEDNMLEIDENLSIHLLSNKNSKHLHFFRT